jgi:hypothetical protein
MAGVRLVHSHSSSLKIFRILNLIFDEASSIFCHLMGCKKFCTFVAFGIDVELDCSLF